MHQAQDSFRSQNARDTYRYRFASHAAPLAQSRLARDRTVASSAMIAQQKSGTAVGAAPMRVPKSSGL